MLMRIHLLMEKEVISHVVTVSLAGSANESHAGLMTQEKILMYMIQERKITLLESRRTQRKIDATWDGERKGYKIEKFQESY